MNMKITKIYSFHYNRADFIKWQNDSFKHHMAGPYELIIVNNARDDQYRQQIAQACTELNLQSILTNSGAVLPGKHHADALNFIWKNHAVNDDLCMLIDGDCFAVAPIDVTGFIGDAPLAGPYQKRPPHFHYLTPSLLIAQPRSLPDALSIDWEGCGVRHDGTELRLDSGGSLYLYYLTHPEIKRTTKEIRSSWHIKAENENRHCLPDELLSEYRDEFMIEFFGSNILHYRDSSNWTNNTSQHHIDKTAFVKKFVYGTIEGTVIAKQLDFQTKDKFYFGWD